MLVAEKSFALKTAHGFQASRNLLPCFLYSYDTAILHSPVLFVTQLTSVAQKIFHNSCTMVGSDTDKEVPKITFAFRCPFTKERHTFTLSHDDVLSVSRLETIAYEIRHSQEFTKGLSAGRSRALMELIHIVVQWKNGTWAKHPLLPSVGTYKQHAAKSTELATKYAKELEHKQESKSRCSKSFNWMNVGGPSSEGAAPSSAKENENAGPFVEGEDGYVVKRRRKRSHRELDE